MNEFMERIEKQRAMQTAACDMPIPYQPPTIKENLQSRRAVLLAELDRIEAALKIFETEPRTADALETIMKAMRWT